MQTTDIASVWETVKNDLQGIFPQDVYRTWFENVKFLEEKDDSIVLGVPNDFAAIWISDNYHDLIKNKIQMAAGLSFKVVYRSIGENNQSSSGASAILPRSSNNHISQYSSVTSVSQNRINKSKGDNEAGSYVLNPKNTFENYVVGSCNQLAHAACLAVTNAPARAYNPLFLYGDTGLGKTHLMHAVAHAVLKKKPDSKIAYISTEKFTNEFIFAIQDNSLPKFRKRYRNVDLLLIDDIHFLSGKERIQEEFFHTFNDLFEAQKQIFLSSDRPASEIAKLESRLVSRFQWGLVTDLQTPDLETRMAILSKKAEGMNLHLPKEILYFLAERVSRNVRRMEGALTRVAGYAALIQGPLDIPVVERLLKDILQEEAQYQLTVEKIQKIVTEYYRLRPSDMQSKRRPANIAFPRQVAMYLCRCLTPSSLDEIGEAFGGRDHGTVIHACKSVDNMIEQDHSIKRTIEYLKTQLGAK